MKDKQNRLARANSPYLVQHADNPVDWHEWGGEALAIAAKENKPLIISIGYAACHWCHVMAHESFMDPEIAEYMNAHFLCIKVDREERPDIDQIYMEAAQIISGIGGWPLNAFALPNGRPFYAGTYFPRNQWLELLKRIVAIYESQYADLEKQAESLTTALQSAVPMEPVSQLSGEFSREKYKALLDNWEEKIDQQDGGFNSVPKFPLPAAWEFLLQYYYLTRNEQALLWVNRTLQAMSCGGIYDQAGGGFSRYSTDKYWKVPHFEKMLYDNAQLISLYSHAYQVTHETDYAAIIKHTLDFAERELMNTEGSFYSSLDADSEGEEGKFYTFTWKELKEILDPSDFQPVTDYYRATEGGNWEKGRNILFRKGTALSHAGNYDMPAASFSKMLDRAHEKLMQFRDQRIRPATDEKIITAWNSLMIKALLDAYHALDEPAFLETALKTTRFICNNMLKPSGILYRSYMHGKVTIAGFLDDYSFFADALIKLYEATFDRQWLDLSRELTQFVLDHFSDDSNPLFFYTSNLSESLIARKKEISDHVIPSSNSVIVNVLNRLGLYFDLPSHIRRASDILRHVENNMSAQGPYFANYAMAFGWNAFIPAEIAIIGEHAGEKNIILQKNYLPTSIISGGRDENLPLLLNKWVKDATLIYVCKNKTCQMPVEDVDSALKFIN